MIYTRIYIRAKIAGRWESVDIADPRLPADELLRWLARLSDPNVVKTMEHVRAAIIDEGEKNVAR